MITRLGNARWKSLAPKNPPANARVARNERSCLKRGAFVSSSMPRELPLSKIGASPSSLRGALAPGLTDDFFDISDPRLGRARIGPFLQLQSFSYCLKRRIECYHSSFATSSEIRATLLFHPIAF